MNGTIAQLVERWPEEPSVEGSTPSGSTLFVCSNSSMVEFLFSKEGVVGSSPICCSMISHSSMVEFRREGGDTGSNPVGFII